MCVSSVYLVISQIQPSKMSVIFFTQLGKVPSIQCLKHVGDRVKLNILKSDNFFQEKEPFLQRVMFQLSSLSPFLILELGTTNKNSQQRFTCSTLQPHSRNAMLYCLMNSLSCCKCPSSMDCNCCAQKTLQY